MVMAVAVWMLQRDNLDGRVLRAQFRDATNWISNVLIIVNVIMIPVVRLWMRFETSWPGGAVQVAFEKAAWIVYSLLYPLPYGFFMLLGTVGFFSSLVFVRHIYRAIKCD